MELDLGQIISQIIAFLILLFFLKRYAWKPVLNLLEERQARIAGEFAHIEKEKQVNEANALDYANKLKTIDNQAHQRFTEEVARGEKRAQEIIQEARQHAEAIREKSQEEVEIQYKLAKKQLKKDLVDLTILATEKMLKEKLDKERDEELVVRFVDEALAKEN